MIEVTKLDDGRLLFVFESIDVSTNVENDESYRNHGGLSARIVEVQSDGTMEVGDAFRLNPYQSELRDIQLSLLSDGKVLITSVGQVRDPYGYFYDDVITRILNFDGSGTDGNDTLVATSPTEGLIGLEGDDTLIGSGGTDLLEGGPGSDIIDGNAGFDTARYARQRAELSVELLDDKSILLTEQDGSIDTLYEIEKIELLDGDLLYEMDSANLGFTYRLYSAGFGRVPDEEGLRFWSGVMDYVEIYERGLDKEMFLARQFLNADEYITLYGANPSNEQYIGDMYMNVLGRLPDKEGYDFWVWAMNEGYSREEILVLFAESVENREKTAPDLDDGVWVV